ncbi:hypothetical protein ACLOJK_014539, partial [Asimina triloba]
MEDGGQPAIDDLKEFNPGTEEDQRPIFISQTLPDEERQRMILKGTLEMARERTGTLRLGQECCALSGFHKTWASGVLMGT